MARRAVHLEFVLRDIVALCLCLLPCGACGETPSTPVEARNVLIVYVDTLRADHLGAYGHAAPTSPNIDALAAEGALFSEAHAASPWTYASTASLVTGLLPAAHGAIIPGILKNELTKPAVAELAPGFQTLAEHFSAAGFRTAFFARNGYVGHGIEQGFGTYVNSRQSNADNQVQLALKWLDKQPGSKPFLLAVHFIDVHEPNRPDAASLAAFPLVAALSEPEREQACRFRGAAALGDAAAVAAYREHRQGMYDASIRDMDRAVGALLAGLGERRRDTLIVFSADHGEEFWDHEDLERSLYSDPRPEYGIGHGHSFFRELVHVPLIMVLPGGIRPARLDAPVSLVDVLPTLLDYAGLPPAGDIDGRSLRPLLEGATLAERPLIFDSVCFGRDKQGILAGRWKFVRSNAEPDLLLDLQADPGETTNVAAGYPGEVAALKAALEATLAASRARGDALRHETAVIHEMSPDELEDLEALGYIK